MTRGRTLRLVCLDVGDTLIRPAPSWTDVYLAACRDQGLVMSRTRLEAAFATALAGDRLADLGPFEATAAASFARIRGFDAAVMAAAGRDDLPEAFYHGLAARFAAPGSWHVFPDVVPALRRLRRAGLRLAVISNWVWDAPRLLATLGLEGWFEAVVISDRVGYAKPHPAIFRAALDATAVAPASAVHVGDSVAKDVAGAVAVGMAAILLRRPDAAGTPGPGDHAGLVVARDLLEVADRLTLARGAPR